LNSIFGQQFKKVETEKFVLKTDLTNNCCVSFDGSILVIKSIIQNDLVISLICYTFETVYDLLPSIIVLEFICVAIYQLNLMLFHLNQFLKRQ
jgi:hypothetical protein